MIWCQSVHVLWYYVSFSVFICTCIYISLSLYKSVLWRFDLIITVHLLCDGGSGSGHHGDIQESVVLVPRQSGSRRRPCDTLWVCTIAWVIVQIWRLCNCVACEAWRHIGITLSGVCLRVRACVCLSDSHTFLIVTLVNTIETKPLHISLSNLQDMLTVMRGCTLLILEVRGQRSRSHWTSMEISLWTQ